MSANRLPALVVALAAAAVGCGHPDNQAPRTSNAVRVTMTNSGGGNRCVLDTTTVPAGPVTFTVSNASAVGISHVELLKDQRVIGEKESLDPGEDPVSFTVTLDGGAYQIFCPGADIEYQTLTVTGRAPAPADGPVAAMFAKGAKDFAPYVVNQMTQLNDAVRALDAAVQSGNVENAKAAYAQARPFYERVQSSVDGYLLPGFTVGDNAGNLDYLIDMQEATPVDPKVGWKGFHAIERDLWQAGAITAGTKALSTELVSNIGTLTTTATTLQFRPEDLANGAADLIEDVYNTKITGQEEAFSHLDLVDFAANVEGSQHAYSLLRPGLDRIDSSLVQQIDQQFQDVLAMLGHYRDPAALGGYRIYTPDLRERDTPKLTAVVVPLHQSLSAVAQKVVSAN
ncbi:iron uptake system protein EfeO [Mycobacterium sp. TY814]|uniref:iron uptake system protein EfeO n=1 Tax=unclassified Mycobacterium TaxID=2642494 RepID=UPI002741D6BE|nr:iron uptake system protein EfeO [Mycobacterium sp. TY814]MDP7724139.1 iron uptake system protein EfeO [Mycobacterium sp. TY814]